MNVNMNKVDSEKYTKEISEILERKLERCKRIGIKKWSDQGGYQHEEKVYELINNQGIIWASTTEWGNASTLEANRRGIITTFPKNSDPLGQIFEMTLPYYFSNRFSTRVYEHSDTIEIRNYGRFTIGRRGLKKQMFFDYLRKNGFES